MIVFTAQSSWIQNFECTTAELLAGNCPGKPESVRGGATQCFLFFLNGDKLIGECQDGGFSTMASLLDGFDFRP